MADFNQLVAECNVPPAVASLLSAFDIALFARSCTTSAELEELVNHFLAEASVTEAAERFITKASLRLLFCKCRQSEGMSSLEDAHKPSTPLGDGPAAATPEAWPAKLSGERTAALRKRFEEDYPTELLDAESFPSARLLALTNKMLSDKEVRWIPWKYRLSARAQEDSPASFGLVTQLLSLAANAIALCQGAHLGSLKLYNKRFMRICFTKYEAAASLRGPTTMEAQAADRRCWEIISDLVNVHHWKLDDVLHEVAEVRSDLHSLLAPRPFIPKPKFDPDNSWKSRFTGNGRGGKGGGRGGKGRDGKGEKGERFERGGKGGKGKDNKQVPERAMQGPGYLPLLAQMRSAQECSAGATSTLPKASAPVSCAASALSEGSLDFATCLELLAQYFSTPFTSSSHCPDTAIAASEAYFNLGAFAFDNGTRSGIFQRTEQFSDVLRFLNAFMQLQFPEASWSSLCVSHNVHARLHTDAGNAAGTLNHTVSLGNFSGGEVWLCPALDPEAPQVPAPLDASSEAQSATSAGQGELWDTWHAPLSFSCESLHCTMPIQGDRWVLTAYTCKNLDHFDAKSLAHLRSLGFPLPSATPVNPQPISPPLKDTTCVELFLDICCGAARPLTTAMSSCGVTCLPIDLLGEEQLDLLNDDTYDHLLRLCFSGIVRLAHGSPPCKEYSRLKLRPGVPPAIRSPDHLNGLPGNTASQQARVHSSQKLLYRCVCLLRAAFGSGAHVSLEQPTNAMSWLEPFVQDMLSEIQASLVNIPACSVGQDIAKSWLLACSYSEFRCLAGTCVHEGGHQSVAGARDERGNFLSQRTAEYPSQLAGRFSEKAVNLFSSSRPSYPVAPCSLKFALASIPKKPRSATPTAAQDGGGIYSLPDWSLGPRYQSDSLHDLRKDWNFSVKEGQPYCLSALERLSTMLGDKELIEEEVSAGYIEEVPNLEAAYERWGRERVAVGRVNIVKAPGRAPRLVIDNSICNTNQNCHVPEQFSLPSLQDIQAAYPPREDEEPVSGFSLDVKGVEECLRHRLVSRKQLDKLLGIHAYLDDKLRFTGSPPGTSISPGSTLLSARHKALRSKDDLASVPVSTKRMWLRITDPTSSKRRLSESSRETLAFFAHLSSREWRPRPLRPPPTSAVESAADAFGKGNDCGVGGSANAPDANLDISSYETLAQCFVLLAFWKAHGSGRLALTLPALSDNSGAESVCNKLYTSKVPLTLFVRKLSMWSSITGVTLDCSHIAGEKNDDADLLSRWDGSTELPDKFLTSNRIELSLSEFWLIRFQVTLFPADTFLKWQLPSADSLGPTNRGSKKRK
ncbi:unnamed protein product [Symbiodinium sp. CCMP2592]|nr:unnamed protein product [Symbiodinium sp. CCMP2592]